MNVVFKKGLLANLPATKVPGSFLITTDERAIYLDVDAETRIRLGDFIEVANLTELTAITNASTTALYYCTAENILAKYNGTKFVQINPDRGATTFTVEGTGNAITTVSYNEDTRTLTLTKGETFATGAELTAAVASLEQKITDAEYDDTALQTAVSANTAAITVLNGTGEGSVQKQVSDAVAAIVADAPEAYDTLKEISDWISSHSDSAAAMNTQIQANKTDIEALETLVGTLPEGAASATVVAYIQEAINTSVNPLTNRVTAAETKLETIQGTGEGSITKAAADTLQSAKDYADGLADNYDAAGAAAAVQTALTGTTSDASTALTLNGIKKFAQEQAQTAVVTWIDF